MKRFLISLLSVILVLTPFSTALAEYENLSSITGQEVEESENKIILLQEDEDEPIYLFEKVDAEDYLIELSDNTEAIILESDEEELEINEKNSEIEEGFTFIEVVVEAEKEEDEDEIFQGFVEDKFIHTVEEAELVLEEREKLEESVKESDEVVKKKRTESNENEDTETNEEEIDAEPSKSESTSQKVIIAAQSKSIESLEGLALRQPVAVYENNSRNSKVLKSYKYGSRLKYRNYSKDWYIATVYVKGKKYTGYIHKSDVGEAKDSSSVFGEALKNKTSVYSNQSKNSKVLKSYNKGHILKYKAYSKDWLSATVINNGKAIQGYIHVNDVETGKSVPKTLRGYGLNNPTKVYRHATTSSKTLKSYRLGSNLKYKEFTSNWYEATVFVKGKAQKGYIAKSHVGSKAPSINGYAQKSPTAVYSGKSKNSNVLKSYAVGSKLKYRPHDKNWYTARVKVKGKYQTGYIHKNDVGSKAPSISGYASKNPSRVYASTSRSSKVLKNYAKGSKIKYQRHNSNWYKARVKVGGKYQTGYFHKNDVSTSAPQITGYATKSPTRFYTSPNRKSSVVKTYKKGSYLKVRAYNNSWYRGTVYVNGKKRTAYIHKNDLGDATNVTFVNPLKTYTYSNMVNDIKKLKKAYPDLIDYKVIGKSEYGRDIYAVKLGKGQASTYINGSIHAREWITTSLNMYMMESYAKAYKKNTNIKGYNARNILNNTSIWFTPMVNPDGVTLQQSGLSAFPKKDHNFLIRANGGSRNFKRWKANAKGVDINRNFSVHWGTQDTTKGPNHQNYRGPRALSSKEAQAMANFVKDIRPQMTINYHSSGEVIYWKYRQSRANMNRDYRIARTIGNMTGYTLMESNNGRKSSVSGGGFLQYFTGTYNLPSITPELAPYAGNTNVSPTRQFNRIWSKNQAVGLYAAQESRKMYK